MQVYDRAGNTLMSELRVNPSTAGMQSAGDIAMNSGGMFAVSWSDSDSCLFVRQFRANGAPVSSPVFAAHELARPRHTGPDQREPSGWNVYAQRYTGDRRKLRC